MRNIDDVLKDYFDAWNKGLITKNSDGIREYMSRDFVGYWANSDINEPDPYYYDYDITSSLKQMDNAKKSFEPFSITERNKGKEILILGKETNLINGEPYTAQCMFIWREESGQWKLLREYIELER
ncbi:DUF4440 domain-containing protein [Virgibacillus kekensis]|uniref:DUF4440 domain-containing protein n=1 Tax=Virgibacillus kekensis TaxID=202261 RepID=A0ABV9DMF5_9BACI